MAVELAKADSLVPTRRCHWRYWELFFEKANIRSQEFGRPKGGTPEEMRALRSREAFVLGMFVCFVVAHPRRQVRQELNGVSYAKQAESTIRSIYAQKWYRRPGLAIEDDNQLWMRDLLKGLHKFNPRPKPRRKPILAQHLRAIREELDLNGNHLRRTLWALWLTQWQGVM